MVAAASSSSAASAPRSGEEIREAFLNFYAERGHKQMARASLTPEHQKVMHTIADSPPTHSAFLGHHELPAPPAPSAQELSRTNHS